MNYKFFGLDLILGSAVLIIPFSTSYGDESVECLLLLSVSPLFARFISELSSLESAVAAIGCKSTEFFMMEGRASEHDPGMVICVTC